MSLLVVWDLHALGHERLMILTRVDLEHWSSKIQPLTSVKDPQPSVPVQLSPCCPPVSTQAFLLVKPAWSTSSWIGTGCSKNPVNITRLRTRCGCKETMQGIVETRFRGTEALGWIGNWFCLNPGLTLSQVTWTPKSYMDRFVFRKNGPIGQYPQSRWI